MLYKSKKKEDVTLLYNVGYTPFPIGSPVIYHNIIIAIQTKLIIKQYGIIIFKLLPIVIGLCLFGL